MSGWLEAFAYIWTIAALNLTYAAGVALGVHPVVFLLEAFLVGSLAMLALVGPGPEPWRIARVPQTWGYGAATIGCEIFYYMMIAYVPPAEASIFIRFTVPFAIAIGWLWLGRPVRPVRAVGALLVVAGIVYAFLDLPHTHHKGFVAVSLIAALVMASRNFFAEFHPWNRAAKSITEKMRVVGLVALTTSLAGLALCLVLAGLTSGGLMPPLKAVPTPVQLVHGPTLLLALLMGGIIITTMQYLMFSAVVKITSEAFFSVMVLVPLTTLILQEAASRLGVIGAAPGGWYILPYIGLILAANILVVWPARKPPVSQAALSEPAPRR